MPALRRFDQVSLTVADLEVMLQFFQDLGCEVEGLVALAERIG